MSKCHPKVYAADKYAELEAAGLSRPPCKCHGEPQKWNADAQRLAGGSWRCAVKSREADNARYDTPEGKAAKAEYAGSEKGKATRAEYDGSEEGKAARAKYDGSEKGKATRDRNSGYASVQTRRRRAASIANNEIALSDALVTLESEFGLTLTAADLAPTLERLENGS